MEKRRMLVSGTGGFVGSRVVDVFRDRYDVRGFARGMLRTAGREEICAFVEKVAPDVIVHTAAISDTGACERHPDESYRANVEIAVWIAEAAARTGAKLLSFSSDQVYTGRSDMGPFTEDEPLAPANVYGRHKLEAEARTLDIAPDAVMLRANWMYDMPGYNMPTHMNPLLILLHAVAHNKKLVCGANDYRCLTYVRQVCRMLEPACGLPGGAYNFGGANRLDMYELHCEFMRALGLEGRIDDILVRDADSAPGSLSISDEKLRKHGIFFDDSAAGMRRCIQDYGLAGIVSQAR